MAERRISQKPSIVSKKSLSRVRNDSKGSLGVIDEQEKRSKIEGFFNDDIEDQKSVQSYNRDDDKGKTISFKKGKPAKPYNFAKLPDTQKEDLFLKTYEENIALKKKQQEMERSMKQLSTQLHVIEQEYSLTKKGVPGEKINRDNLQALDELKRENNQLRDKLLYLQTTQSIEKTGGQRKSTMPPKKSVKQVDEEEDDQQLFQAKGRLSDMIRLVEMLKKQLKDSQEQNRNLQQMLGSKIKVDTNDTSTKNVQLQQLKSRYDEIYMHFQNQSKKLEQTNTRVVELNMSLNEERDKAARQETLVRQMDIKIKSSEATEEELYAVRKEKSNLEIRLRELSQSPFFEKFKEEATNKAFMRQLEAEIATVRTNYEDQQRKVKQLETELKLKNEEIQNLQETISKSRQQLAEMDATIKTQNSKIQPFKDLGDLDSDYYMKQLGIDKWKGEDPIWRHLEVIDRQHRDINDIKNPEDLRKEINNLIMEKGELAAHLQKAQQQLQDKVLLQAEKENLMKNDMKKLEIQLKQSLQRAEELAKLQDIRGYPEKTKDIMMGKKQFNQQGVKYSDSVSVFSTDDASVYGGDDQVSTNILDLFLGEVDFQAVDVSAVTHHRLTDEEQLSHLNTFCTVDFYNHETQHSNMAIGLKSQYKFQVSFKILVDEFFVQYLNTGQIRIEIYAAVGSEPMRLGTVLLPLNELVKQNLLQENVQGQVCAVIQDTAHIKGLTQLNQPLIIGAVQYKMRLRYPIAEKIKQMAKLLEYDIKIDDQSEELIQTRKRKLVVLIDSAEELPAKSNCFVYFQFQGKDYMTPNCPSARPKWNYKERIEVLFDEQLKNYLRTNSIEFVVFDDIQSLNSENLQSDFIGGGQAPLDFILQEDYKELKIELKGGASKDIHAGVLNVKIFWSDSSVPDKPQAEDGIMNQTWQQDITLKIARTLKSKYLNLQNAFMIFDKDLDSIISFSDFEGTMSGALQLKYHQEEYELYYKNLPQPLDFERFAAIFRPYLLDVKTGYEITEEPYFMHQYYQKDDGDGDQFQHIPVNFDMSKENYLKLNQKSFDRLRQQLNSLFEKLLSQGKNAKQIFGEIDKDNNGKASFSELRIFLQKYSFDCNDDDLSEFLALLDKDQDQKLNLEEFMQYIMGREIDLRERQSRPQSQEALASLTMKETKIIQQCRESLLQYMSDKHITFIMDQNRDNNLNKKEIRDFFKDKVKLQLSMDELNIFANYCDKNGDDKISINEFINSLKSLAIESQGQGSQYKQLWGDQSKRSTKTVQQLVQYMARYMKQQKINMSSLFNRLDRNKDGFLSREEMKTLFYDEFKLDVGEEEFNNFYDSFDINKDQNVNIQEFFNVINPELEKAQRESKLRTSSIPNVQLENLRQKVADITRDKGDLIYKYMQAYEKRQGEPFVDKDKFIENLQICQVGFTAREILDITENLTQTSLDGDINYRAFLGIGNKKYQEVDKETLGNSVALAESAFLKIAKILKAKNIKPETAFKSFDLDGDQKITADELYKCFKQMKLDFTQRDVDMMMFTLDKDQNGWISLDEFKAAIKINK